MSPLQHQAEALSLLCELYSNTKVRNNPEPNRATVPLAVRARESLLAGFVENLSRLITIEHELLRNLNGDVKCFLRRKDSVDLKNICLRMAVSESGYESDRNLNELRLCLELIINNLLSAVRDHNPRLSSTRAFRQLIGISISITLPDV